MFGEQNCIPLSTLKAKHYAQLVSEYRAIKTNDDTIESTIIKRHKEIIDALREQNKVLRSKLVELGYV